jgi:hypothetical protein
LLRSPRRAQRDNCLLLGQGATAKKRRVARRASSLQRLRHQPRAATTPVRWATLPPLRAALKSFDASDITIEGLTPLSGICDDFVCKSSPAVVGGGLYSCTEPSSLGLSLRRLSIVSIRALFVGCRRVLVVTRGRLGRPSHPPTPTPTLNSRHLTHFTPQTLLSYGPTCTAHYAEEGSLRQIATDLVAIRESKRSLTPFANEVAGGRTQLIPAVDP